MLELLDVVLVDKEELVVEVDVVDVEIEVLVVEVEIDELEELVVDVEVVVNSHLETELAFPSSSLTIVLKRVVSPITEVTKVQFPSAS
jgi:hypothetical protein